MMIVLFLKGITASAWFHITFVLHLRERFDLMLRLCYKMDAPEKPLLQHAGKNAALDASLLRMHSAAAQQPEPAQMLATLNDALHCASSNPNTSLCFALWDDKTRPYKSPTPAPSCPSSARQPIRHRPR
jgi:hypothetical protein